MTGKYSGVINGNKIELDVLPEGYTDGERVKVTLEAESQSSRGEGIKGSAGSLADDEDFEKAMEQIQRDRKVR